MFRGYADLQTTAYTWSTGQRPGRKKVRGQEMKIWYISLWKD